MAIPISSSRPVGSVQGTLAPAKSSSSGGTGFGEALQGMLKSVDQSAGDANTALSTMMEGGDVHEAMIALQRAQTSLEMVVQVRNKLVQAYQDIMRMPV